MTTHQVEGVECINQAGGQWYKAIPLPYYINILWFYKRVRCICGRKFKTEDSYRNHFLIANEEEWFLND